VSLPDDRSSAAVPGPARAGLATVWPALRGVRAAFVFLTRVPVGGFPYTADEWRWSAAHFPLVGAVLGALLGAVDRALSPLGDPVAALGAIGASLLLTGAFHEDGLADTSDALGGAADRDKILLILKDSRVGAFGACAVAVSIVGRALLIARLGAAAAWALPLVGAAARVGPIWQLASLPYVTPDAQARSSGVARARLAQACLGTAWAAVVGASVVAAGLVSAARLAALFAAMTIVTLLTAWRYARRLGGITGDFLGATEQICELVALASLAWA
jgi:adenosylcobinamide-GDP ribazoletransferase